MTRDLIIPFTREYKRYVLSGGQSLGRLVIPSSNKVFIVHGHDEAALRGLARFLEKLGLEAIVLREQPNKGLPFSPSQYAALVKDSRHFLTVKTATPHTVAEKKRRLNTDS